MSEPLPAFGKHPMRTQPIRLSRRCPVCGGRSHAEAKMPLSQGIRAVELNLDQPAHLAETLSLHLLLALVELLPYKQFTCQRCFHEFRLASQTTRQVLFGLLSSMEPVAPPRPQPVPEAKRPSLPSPKPPTVKEFKSPVVRPKAPAQRPQPAPPGQATPAAPAPGGPDWTPYHLDQDLDALFDQFKEE